MGLYRNNEVYLAVARVLSDRNIRFTTAVTRRSVKIDFDYRGRKLRVNTPLSPSDHRAPKKAESWLKRKLRTVDIDVEEQASSGQQKET